MHAPTAFVSTISSHRTMSSSSSQKEMTGDLVASFAGDVFTATTTGGLGDVIAQFVENRGKSSDSHSSYAPSFRFSGSNTAILSNAAAASSFQLDTRRTLAYAALSGIYSGAFQHFWFPALQSMVSHPLGRLAVNQGLMIPLLYYPLLVWMVPKLRARSSQERQQLRNTISVRKTIPKNWAFWIPLQFIQFQFLPDAYYVTYCSICGLVWKVLLSLMTAGGRKGKKNATN